MIKVFDITITDSVADFLNNSLGQIICFEIANKKIYDNFGIVDFFDSNEELKTIKEAISYNKNFIKEPDRSEYGDFQTNFELTNKVTLFLSNKDIDPEILVEPTCGKGNFIIASMKNFKNIKYIFGIEIYKPYVWETKFNIINFFLENPEINKPETSIIHCNIFDFDFKQIAKQHSEKDILIIGNPPWVTNSKLGSLNSSNLPKKINFKNHSGLDAMTGKGNFDIAEYITLIMIEAFEKMNGYLLLLVKNSVIKNIVFDQNKNKYKISSIEKLSIDSKKEFNVSVEASLLFCKLNSVYELFCKEFNFYDSKDCYQKFGWLDNKFVSNIETYIYTKEIDGICPFVWRQGLKHDCSKIMELDKVNEYYVNGLDESIKLEDGLVYGLLKSSDLKKLIIDNTRKFTIVTQKKVGQETKYIEYDYPETYKYLIDHQESFNARKSSIYNNKPLFSIFGIGDYSFKPYKIAISGLYKTFHFTLVLPQNDKPIMLDDTCYLLGFDNIDFSAYTLILLNSNKTMKFLQSITFSDAKRTFTKDVLMRINLLELAKNIDKNEFKNELKKLNEVYNLNLTFDLWLKFLNSIELVNNGQISMFA